MSTDNSTLDRTTAAVLDDLARHGVAVIPDVLSQTQASEALERLWAASGESQKRGIPAHIAGLDPNASNVRVFNLIDLDPFFGSLVEHPVPAAILTSVLGPNYILSNISANIARPGSRSMAVHSDLQFVVPEPWNAPQSVNVIWCLTDSYGDNGATLYAPGSHRLTTLGDVPSGIGHDMVPLEAAAGSVILMEGRVWHTSGNNITTDGDRALVFGYYTAPYIRPQWNFSAALSPDTQAAQSPTMRYRLGLDASLNAVLVNG